MSAPAEEVILHFPPMPAPSRLHQLHRHIPGKRPVGDCYRTVLACLLGASSPGYVPHFTELTYEPDDEHGGWATHRAARHWLRDTLGLDLWPATAAWCAPLDRPYFVGVRSRTGPWGHVVIACGGEVVHDPSERRIAELGVAPYTWADVDPDEVGAGIIVEPYAPDPDAQVAAWWDAERVEAQAAERTHRRDVLEASTLLGGLDALGRYDPTHPLAPLAADRYSPQPATTIEIDR